MSCFVTKLRPAKHPEGLTGEAIAAKLKVASPRLSRVPAAKGVSTPAEANAAVDRRPQCRRSFYNRLKRIVINLCVVLRRSP